MKIVHYVAKNLYSQNSFIADVSIELLLYFSLTCHQKEKKIMLLLENIYDDKVQLRISRKSKQHKLEKSIVETEFPDVTALFNFILI